MSKKERFKLVPSSYLIIIKDGKILLSRRYNTGYEDGSYSLVAGHVDEHEAFTQALVREVKEESSLDINPDDVEVIHVMHRKCPNDERIDIFFKVNKWKGDPKIMEPDKCDDISWFSLDALPKNTVPYIRKAIENISKGIFYSEFGW